MSREDYIVKDVANSMKIEGFALTNEDAERIRAYLEHPDMLSDMIQELVGKHKMKA